MHVSYLYDMALPSRYAAAIQILNTCRALCNLGAAVDVYVKGMAGSQRDCLAYYGLEEHPSLRLLSLPQHAAGAVDIQALREHLAARAPGTEHVVISRGDPGIRLLPALAALPRPGVERYVYEAHRLCFSHHTEEHRPDRSGFARASAWVRARRMRSREAATLRCSDGVICLTSGVRAALEKEFGLVSPSLILPSGTALCDDVLPGDDARDIDIVYAGKIERRKGVALLLEAMRHLDGHRAWIVGGSEEQVRELGRDARALGVAERIVLTGYVEPSHVRSLYHRAKVGVCPLPTGVSRIADEFTSPLKILEMMALGVPVVATDLPSTRELLDDGRTALLVPANDAPALADGIQRLLENREIAKTLATRARERVAQFSWEERARRLLDFLRALP